MRTLKISAWLLLICSIVFLVSELGTTVFLAYVGIVNRDLFTFASFRNDFLLNVIFQLINLYFYISLLTTTVNFFKNKTRFNFQRVFIYAIIIIIFYAIDVIQFGLFFLIVAPFTVTYFIAAILVKHKITKGLL